MTPEERLHAIVEQHERSLTYGSPQIQTGTLPYVYSPPPPVSRYPSLPLTQRTPRSYIQPPHQNFVQPSLRSGNLSQRRSIYDHQLGYSSPGQRIGTQNTARIVAPQYIRHATTPPRYSAGVPAHFVGSYSPRRPLQTSPLARTQRQSIQPQYGPVIRTSHSSIPGSITSYGAPRQTLVSPLVSPRVYRSDDVLELRNVETANSHVLRNRKEFMAGATRILGHLDTTGVHGNQNRFLTKPRVTTSTPFDSTMDISRVLGTWNVPSTTVPRTSVVHTRLARHWHPAVRV